MSKEKDQRPMSPHLQIYKWETHMLMSILHRATGVAISAGLTMLTAWLVWISQGEAAWQNASRFFGNPFVMIILFCWSVALMFHLCTGVRHLVWDIGLCLGKEQSRKSGKFVMVGTAVLTVIMWLGILL